MHLLNKPISGWILCAVKKICHNYKNTQRKSHSNGKFVHKESAKTLHALWFLRTKYNDLATFASPLQGYNMNTFVELESSRQWDMCSRLSSWRLFSCKDLKKCKEHFFIVFNLMSHCYWCFSAIYHLLHHSSSLKLYTIQLTFASWYQLVTVTSMIFEWFNTCKWIERYVIKCGRY